MVDQNKGGVGPMVAVVVIVIILAIGGLYFLTAEVKRMRESGGAVPTLQ